jgi:hypothetical protein
VVVVVVVAVMTKCVNDESNNEKNIKMLFADCYVDDAPKKHPPRVNNKTNERKFKYEKEKSRWQWIIAIVDCIIPPPQTPIIYLILGGRILGVTLIH